jgi:soluble lytic murein transglycosylase
MTDLSARRLLAPLAMMMLSTLSCAVLGPGPLPPLANTRMLGPELPDGYSLIEVAVVDTASPTLDGVLDDSGVDESGMGPEIVRAALRAEPPTPSVAAISAEVLPRRSEAVEEPIEEAVLAHLMRYRSRTGLTDGEIGRLSRRIVKEARRHGFDPGLVLAVMHVESRYDTFAVSNRDAMGLMQILPSTGEWMARKMGVPWEGPQTLFDPIVNVKIGVAYLRELADRYGSIHTALSAYNWGPGAIDRRIERGAPLPKIYAQLVLDALDRAPSS